MVTHLSGGEKRRVALCKLLLSKPDLLLLDEPTNHLDAESVLWLEQHLAAYPGAILAVTHDRYFLDHVAQWICEVDRGRLYPYEATTPPTWSRRLHASKLPARRIRSCRSASRTSSHGSFRRQARQAKNKARLDRYEEMANEAEKTRKLDFDEIQIPAPPRLGDVVVEVSNLDKGFDGRVLIKDLSFTLPRNGIVGVIGPPNGVGKTTLFKTIVGLEEPDAGEVKIGQTVKLSYVDQNRSGIDPKKTVWETVSDGLDFIVVGQTEFPPSRAYISSFGFKGHDQQKPAGVLSGGERNRLNLAMTLKQGGNLILLDEPTNDLDVETLGSLENALEEFPPGCAVVISHDRWFLDRTCTHILAWEGGFGDNEAAWYWYEATSRATRRTRSSDSAPTPHARTA